jgi:hypothetical protein
MTKKKHDARTTLAENALSIIQEIWSGKWEHINGLHTQPFIEIHELTDELKKRSPGFDLDQYQDALSRALRDYR